MRSEIVRQFVSRPPSQRWLTYGMPTRCGLLRDGVLRLLLRADEEDRAAALGDVARRSRSASSSSSERLLEVDDVDAAALGEDEALHLRVPAAGLVAEVDSGLQQLLHGDDCHGIGPFPGLICATAGGARMEPGSERRHRPPVLIAGTKGETTREV